MSAIWSNNQPTNLQQQQQRQQPSQVLEMRSVRQVTKSFLNTFLLYCPNICKQDIKIPNIYTLFMRIRIWYVKRIPKGWFQIHYLLIRHCLSSTTKWWPSTTQLWSWFVANSTALQCRCLAGKAWAVLPLATPGRPFFAPATTVRTVTTLTELVKGAKKGRKKEWKRGEGVGHGQLNFLVRCPTARGEDVQLEAALSIVVSIRLAETKTKTKGGNVHGCSTSWVSWIASSL